MPPLLCLSPEVGVCSFARFSGESLQRGPSTPDLAPEAPLQDRGRTVCFSALGMVQCCKVGVGVLPRWREETGDRKRRGCWGFWRAPGRC